MWLETKFNEWRHGQDGDSERGTCTKMFMESYQAYAMQFPKASEDAVRAQKEEYEIYTGEVAEKAAATLQHMFRDRRGTLCYH